MTWPINLTAFGRASQSGTLKFSYRYDPAGNRTQEAIVTAVTDFGYNAVNELITRSGAQGAATFTYDSNGSLTSDGTRTFEWDGANRLVAVVIGTHRSEFSYDGIDRRTRIVEKDNSVVTSDHRYVWCGGEICEERDATGAIVQKRFYEQGEQVSGGNFYYTFDHLGSVRELLEFRGVTVTKFDYDPWGRQTKLIGTQDAAFGYAGYFQHQPSGLLLTWYRAYDVNQARWISRDPIEELVGYYDLYSYVGNNPIGLKDPLGLAPWHCIPFAYYALKCGDAGKECKKRVQDEFDKDPIKWCERNPGYPGVGDKLIKECFAANKDCQNMVKYGIKCGAWPVPSQTKRVVEGVRDFK